MSISPHKQSEEHDETDLLGESSLSRTKRAHLSTSTTSGLFFSEVDVRQDVAHNQSVEDISSGYSSGDPVFSGQLHARPSLLRAGSIGGTTRPRSMRITRSSTSSKKSVSITDSEVSKFSLIFKSFEGCLG